ICLMNKIKKILLGVLVTFGIHTQAQVTTVDSSDTVSYYICYNEDNGSSLNLSIGFNNKSRALSVKYKGMNSSMDLIFIKQENENPGGAYPVLVSYYKEMYKEKVNGEYKLTHSGIWDLVEYTRGKDSKKFNFTIDHNSNSYSYTPCF
ncbi:MAG: hypothetical protein ACKVJW_03555, partial [Flavobacteriales bacterium]